MKNIKSLTNSDLLAAMLDKNEENAFRYAEELGKRNPTDLWDEFYRLLSEGNEEEKYLVARALQNMTELTDEQGEAVFKLLEKGKYREGVLMEALEAFSSESNFVDYFKVFLYGSFKSSALARLKLDHEEFVITPRTLKKLAKNWEHFSHNTSKNDHYQHKKEYYETILSEMEGLLSESDSSGDQ
ncbi:MAG: hypothetical protein LAT68_02815 [Cyclobacteriaceae bacterium]|nr:hypothetical protein [Cyclobacteriaceae bacterium]MCH8515237.1 hypothetical protein [Cyclobacteriaceae bacterium]